MKTKILCVLPMTTDPRMALRIQMLQAAGFQVEAIAFETGQLLGRKPDCPVEFLGSLRFRKGYLRMPETIMHLPKIRTAIRRNDIVYAFRFDMLVLVMLAAIGLRKPIVLEIHDIRRQQVTQGLKGRLIRWFDRFATEACRLLVLTSDNYHGYYRDWLKVKTTSLVMENKVEAALAAKVRERRMTDERLDSRRLRIGYFGYLKDEWSLYVLERLTSTAPERFEVVMAGSRHRRFFPGDFLHRIERNPNLHYEGAYQHPTDLPRLYADVDMMMACYPTFIPDRWAQSNRYYDACFFQKPLIVRAGTGDATEVGRRQIGLVLEGDDIEGAAAKISRVSAAQWEAWRQNMAALPEQVYVHTEEDVRRLGAALRQVAARDA